jgi:hypothetical protein
MQRSKGREGGQEMRVTGEVDGKLRAFGTGSRLDESKLQGIFRSMAL